MHAAVNRPGPNGIFPLFQPLIFRGCCWFVGEYYSPIILVQLLPSDTLIPHIEVMFLPLKRSRIKLTRKNLARVPWPKHRPVTGGWWDSGNVCQMRRRLWILCVESLGWVGLVGWLVGCFLLSFFVLEGQEFANRVFAVARLLTSTSSNTMSFVVAELMSLCDPAETVKLGEWPFFS